MRFFTILNAFLCLRVAKSFSLHRTSSSPLEELRRKSGSVDAKSIRELQLKGPSPKSNHEGPELAEAHGWRNFPFEHDDYYEEWSYPDCSENVLTGGCGLYDEPLGGLLTFFEGCRHLEDIYWNEEGVYGCESCKIYEENSILQIDDDDPICSSCSICMGDAISFDCSNVLPGIRCAVQDCSGNCLGDADVGDEASVGFPKYGFVAVFNNCTGHDCGMCSIYEAESFSDVESDSRQCDTCTICPHGVAYDCSNIVENDPCARKDCSGSCIGEGSGGGGCVEEDDDMETCSYEDEPFYGLVTIYGSCPADRLELSECETCAIVEESNIEDIDSDSPKCTTCDLCTKKSEYSFLPYQFDCTNIAPYDPCAAMDCYANCIGEGGWGGCVPNDDEETETCYFGGTPFYELITVFENCPLYGYADQCDSCKIIAETSIAQIDSSDPVCNDCTLCGGYSWNYASFDCSNVDPDNSCFVQDCEGNCIGGTDTSPARDNGDTPNGDAPSGATSDNGRGDNNTTNNETATDSASVLSSAVLFTWIAAIGSAFWN